MSSQIKIYNSFEESINSIEILKLKASVKLAILFSDNYEF